MRQVGLRLVNLHCSCAPISSPKNGAHICGCGQVAGRQNIWQVFPASGAMLGQLLRHTMSLKEALRDELQIRTREQIVNRKKNTLIDFEGREWENAD